MNEDRKITWAENVDGYKVQVVAIKGHYQDEVFFGQALQKAHHGGWVEAWGTAFLPTYEAAREAIRATWNV